MSLVSKLFGSKKSNHNENSSRNESAASLYNNTVNNNVNDNNEEIVAAIMAALVSFMGANAVSDLKIKSIRRLGRTSPVWNIAGRDEYLASKL